jgi:demethylmenaquinone methyltransferase/2-methoxy-6-polyprenyl-1,4-benzoquinol methylase
MSRVAEPKKSGYAWDPETLRTPHTRPDKADRVQTMFDAIAPTYERFNTAATLGRDAHWRRSAVAAAQVRTGDVIVDICCGTGDMIRTFAGAEPRPKLIVGVDFSGGMLAHAGLDRVRTPVQLVRADALRLPLADATADVISCTFGVRNFAVLQAGLDEIARIARPGARVVILEFATPENPLLRWAHDVYCRNVLPWLGSWISGDRSGAYRYLPRSIQTFETTRGMIGRLEGAGFSSVDAKRMNLGGVVLYRGVR